MSGKTVLSVAGGIALGIVILIVALVVTSLKKLDSDEVGLKYNTYTKELSAEPFHEGLHLGPPGYQFIIFPSVFRTLTYTSTSCLNKDGVRIRLSISFQYRVHSKHLFNITEQFKDSAGYEIVLRNSGAAALLDSCSMFNTSQFQSERGRFQEDLTSRLVKRFTPLQCDVTDLQVNDIQRPTGYENAIKDKESSREDIEVAHNEGPQKLMEVQTKKREAQKEAEIITNEARTEARITLNKAQSEATAILNAYEKEAATYKKIISPSGLNLGVEGFLAYLGTRAISETKHPVYVNIKAPAQSSYYPPP